MSPIGHERWIRSAIVSKSRASVPTSSFRRVNGRPTHVERASGEARGSPSAAALVEER
jgi:hypothetical protein